MNIWGFGSAAIDIRVQTADYGVDYREKLLVQQARWMAGGSMANCLAQIARLGGRTAWLGKLGQDPIGNMILDFLRTEGIDTSRILISPDCVSPFNLAAYAGESMRRVCGWLLPNCLAELSESEAEYLAAPIEPGDYLLVEAGELPISLCILLARLAKEKGATVVVDVDLDPVVQMRASPKEARELFSLAHVLMPNVTAMSTLYPLASPGEIAADLAEKNGCTVILTLGSDGATCCEPGGAPQICPTIDVEVVDTVGAGDAFHGGFVYGMSLGMPLKDAVLLGNACGAHNCRTFGAREGMATRKELEQYNIGL